MAFVAIGMCVTVSYQVLIYSDAGQTIFARQSPPAVQVGG